MTSPVLLVGYEQLDDIVRIHTLTLTVESIVLTIRVDVLTRRANRRRARHVVEAENVFDNTVSDTKPTNV